MTEPSAPDLRPVERWGVPGPTPLHLAQAPWSVALPAAPSLLGGLDLVFADPPFATGQSFEATWQVDGQPWRVPAYRDPTATGSDDVPALLEGLLAASHRALDPRGSLLLHVDHRALSLAAPRCDRIFGWGARLPADGPGFRNALIWHYGLGGSSPRTWARKHDTILWYTRGADWHFDPPRVPATSQRLRGQTKKATDVLDIPSLNNMARERCGYPTQKPLALLCLLLGAHVPPGGSVADPCMGSGTTVVAAHRAGLRALGSDVSAVSVGVARQRLAAEGAAFTVWRRAPWPSSPAPEAGPPVLLAARVEAEGDGVWGVRDHAGALVAGKGTDHTAMARAWLREGSPVLVWTADGATAVWLPSGGQTTGRPGG
jgi:hypothetical protein